MKLYLELSGLNFKPSLMTDKNPILVWLKPGPGLQNRISVQKMIRNLYFLFDHRFCHAKYTPKNQSEGVYREKKIYKTFFVPTKLYNDVSRV